MNAPSQPHGTPLPIGADYTLTEKDMDRLWRAQVAAQLLAALDHEGATHLGISHDGPAAVAEYIAEDVLDVLRNTQRQAAPHEEPPGEDLI
ncbi:hypothetical protein [Vulcaniibacterium tengchongense]|uniref:Uncharacterized protein n=1 Tax=Vulcaniibacterium tengchongense TaxID=1273429 RepID=A0A3N4V4J0_9GAMM|nr:hypothetical protein [Vulcaniibacterium tengchongense]RPE74651.1 hypothetical protein EDC50_3180 [Vulcaniibacterium tengchongense]